MARVLVYEPAGRIPGLAAGSIRQAPVRSSASPRSPPRRHCDAEYRHSTDIRWESVADGVEQREADGPYLAAAIPTCSASSAAMTCASTMLEKSMTDMARAERAELAAFLTTPHTAVMGTLQPVCRVERQRRSHI